MLEKLQTYQQILFDLTANYLEPRNGACERLAYLASLRDESAGRYVHQELARFYGAEAVDQVIAHCHQEVFERLLEMPLHGQGEELRLHLNSLPGTFADNVDLCRKQGRRWAPVDAPGYLKELYCSNLDALLELLLDDNPKPPPSS